MDWKIKMVKMTIQSNLQIQYNPYFDEDVFLELEQVSVYRTTKDYKQPKQT